MMVGSKCFLSGPTKKLSPQNQTSLTNQTSSQKSLPCYMFDHTSTSYSQNFPPFETFDHPQTNTKHVWKIKNPVRNNPDGTKRQVSSAEEALNWQVENDVAQNQVL